MTDIKGKVIDLTQLNGDLHREFYAIAMEMKSEVTETIDAINRVDIDWWMTFPASRNPFLSNLFRNICIVELIQRHIKRNDIPKRIVVSSPAQKKVLKNNYNIRNVEINVVPFFFLKMLCYWFRSFLGNIRSIVDSLVFRTAGNLPGKNAEIYIVSTYLYDSSFKKGEFYDRHYPGLFDVDSDEIQSKIWFFPTVYQVRDKLNLKKSVQKSRYNFIFRERFLTISDYLFALMHPFRELFRVGNYPELINNSVRELIREEHLRGLFGNQAVQGILNYRFVEGLKANSINVKCMIDWYENQTHSKALVKGMHDNFPEILITGYCGIPPMPDYFCLTPSFAEYKSRVIPDQIGLIGDQFKKVLQNNKVNMHFFNAPALRFKLSNSKLDLRKNGIGVALPLMSDVAEKLLKMVRELIPDINSTLFIKPHPAMSRIQYDNLISKYLNNVKYEEITTTFEEMLSRISLLISVASSTCFESCASGIPTIIISGCEFLYNPVPITVSNKLCAICFNIDELKAAFKMFNQVDFNTLKVESDLLLSNYYNPTSDESKKLFVTMCGIKENE